MGKRNGILFMAIVMVLTGCASKSGHRAGGSVLDPPFISLAQELTGGLSKQEKARIAVLEFTGPHGTVGDLGTYVAEELTARLFISGKLQVVEQQRIENVMREQRLARTGAVEERTAARAGALMGVDYIITGTLEDLGERVKLDARCVSVEKGSVVSVASVVLPKNDRVAALMRSAQRPR